MRFDKPTDMGGLREAFLTTHWSLLDEIGAGCDDHDRDLIGLLLNLYWKPVYCFLRRKGYDNESAKDLTQDFLHEVVLGRDLIQRADKSKGRFRSFLLTALKRYLINIAEAQSAQKRIPREKLVSLDRIDPAELPQITSELSAEASFDYGWTAALLERVLAEVKAQCQADGKAIYWKVFHDRVLQPIREITDPQRLILLPYFNQKTVSPRHNVNSRTSRKVRLIFIGELGMLWLNQPLVYLIQPSIQPQAFVPHFRGHYLRHG